MPIWLRKFTFGKLKVFYEEKKQAQERASKPPEPTNRVKKPTFITKASK